MTRWDACAEAGFACTGGAELLRIQDPIMRNGLAGAVLPAGSTSYSPHVMI